MHVPKIFRRNKIYISTRKSSLFERKFSPIWINAIVHILMYNMDESPVCFKMLTNMIYSNTNPHMVVPFILVPSH